MILDFELDEIMRLSNIKRWAIIEMSRDQSVAEHSYNVAIICLEIISHIDPAEMELSKSMLTHKTLMWALTHDLPEVKTGDIPTPVKAYIDFDLLEMNLFPKYLAYEQSLEETEIKDIAKAADYLEAIQYCKKYCIDSRKGEILRDIYSNLDKFLKQCSNVHVADAVGEVEIG